MSQTINCPSCGAANQLPEGKNSMFCAFCGSAIKVVEKENKLSPQSSIITKPEISKKKTGKGEELVVKFKWDKYNNIKDKSYFKKTEVILDEGGELTLIDRNIKSLDEITVWFSDNELYEINALTLNKNTINSLKGIERFQSLRTLSLINNEISELPKENTYLKNLFRIYLFGNPIEKSITQEDLNYYLNIRFYMPTIKKITPLPDEFGNIILSCNDLNITTIEEIIDLYSTDELDKINRVKFRNNKIKTLKGLSNFTSIESIDFGKNDLISIDELPNFTRDSMISLDFWDNKNLKEFNDKALEKLYSIPIKDVNLNIIGCNNFNYESLSKINFNKIIYSTDYEFSHFTIFVKDTNIIMPPTLKQIGFIKKEGVWVLPRKGHPNYKKSGCFIATATMGSYEHPTVMELRYFRDNWILQKSWGESFVKWYYHYGAIAAKFIEKSFVLKKTSYLLIVSPLVYLARIVKNK